MLHKDQQGSSMVMFMISITMLLLMTGLAVEISRVLVEREHLKTATEAASLAGALQAIPIVGISVRESRYYCTTVTGVDGRPEQSCTWQYRTVPLQGREEDIVPAWRPLAGCSDDGWTCPSVPTITCRSVRYPSETTGVMARTFARNISGAADVETTLGPMTTNDETGQTRVTAFGSLKVNLMRLAGADRVPYGQWSLSQAQPRELKGWHIASTGNCR